SPEGGGEWGDGNERTRDEASSRRERSETADGRRSPGRGKGSGSRREDNSQGRGHHNGDGIHDFVALDRVEPMTKSFEEDNEAGKLEKAKEIVGVVLPTNEDPALPLDPGEEALDEPASHVAA